MSQPKFRARSCVDLPHLLVFFAFLASLVLADASFSQTTGAGSTSTNFQKIGEGARAVGMGEAFAAVADDATAVFWNPAGLPLARGTEFSITHGEWLVGVTDEFFAFSQNIDKDGAFGADLGYLGTGTFPGALETPSGDYGGVGDDISASSYIGSLAYGQRLGNWFNGDFFHKSLLGVKVTLVGQNVVNIGSAGVAFDMGYLYEVTPKTFYLGAVLSNVGTSIENYSQPLNYVFAGSYRLKNLLMKKDRDIVALSTEGYIDTGLKVDLGDEYKMAFGRNDVFLRLGYRTGSDLGAVAGLTTGVGISHKFDDFEAGLDYAFVPYGVLGLTHRISLDVILGGENDIPKAFVRAKPSFVLDDQTLSVNFSTQTETPLDHWKVSILDSSGMLVKTFEGKGVPPSNFMWDGKNQTGELVPQGNYTINLEVSDEDDIAGKSRPATVFAQWVPKEVPYQYNFRVPGDLLFDSGKAELKPEGYEAIQKAIAAVQKKFPDSMLVIAGHTDNVPLNKDAKFKSNQELSLARAQAVKDYLVKGGMNSKLLSVVGYGDTKPIASNSTPEGRAKNRRFEIMVSGVKEATAPDIIAEGVELMKQKSYREALDRFLKALESDSRSAQAYRLAGDCYLILGGKDQAAESYRESLKYNPGDTTLQNWLRQYAPSASLAKPAPMGTPVSKPAAQAPPVISQPAVSNPVPVKPAEASTTAPAASGVPVPVEAN